MSTDFIVPCLVSMLSAIKLNDQPLFKTAEIYDVGANRMLTPKLKPIELS